MKKESALAAGVVAVIALAALLVPLSCNSVQSNGEAVSWPEPNVQLALPHHVFGEPKYEDHDPKHNVKRGYSGFTVYYDDRVLGPRWVAMKLTSGMADANNDFGRPGRFKVDKYLKEHGWTP
jgi:hypothetical protein